MNLLKDRFVALLRWSERYTKTDMVYLTGSGFWLNLNFVFVSVFALLLSVAFANLLPKTEFGVYQYLLAIGSLLTAFTFSGMNNAITRAVARGYEGTLKQSIPLQLYWNLVPAVLAFGIGGYYLIQGNSVLGIGALAIGVTIPITASFNSYQAYLQGTKRFKQVTFYILSGNALYYLAIFAGIFLIPEALPLVLINLVVNALVALCLYFHTIRTFPPNEQIDSEAVPYARHLTLISVLATIAQHIDKMLVFQFAGATALASYALAILLPDRLVGIFKPLLVAAFPKYAERPFAEIRESLLWKSLLVFLVTTAILYALFAPLVLSFLYPEYTEIIPFSQVYAFTFIATVGHLGSVALTTHRKLRELYTHSITASLSQIALMLIGITFWGLWGLIIARVCSTLIFAAIGLILVQRAKD